eukprot:7435705-Lingulodinium_polyedra.AAC.1
MNCCARGVRERAIGEPLRRRAADLAVSLCSICTTLRNDVVESAVRVCRPQPRRLANRTFARATRAPEKWRA